MPRTFWRYLGSSTSGSSFLRRLPMWLSTTRSVTNVFGPHASLINCARVRIRPRARMKACSSGIPAASAAAIHGRA